MEHTKLTELLHQVASGDISVEKAALELKTEPFEDLGFAKLDHHRKIRQGAAEVIYGAGKTPEQILKITEAFRKKSDSAVLITRMSQEAADLVSASLPLHYNALSKTGIVGELPKKDGNGKIVIATGGTSDLPVAEEAALTAEILGNEVVRIYDVGVAGIHRLLAYSEDLMSAQVIVVIAGMEGCSCQCGRRSRGLSGYLRYRPVLDMELLLEACPLFYQCLTPVQAESVLSILIMVLVLVIWQV